MDAKPRIASDPEDDFLAAFDARETERIESEALGLSAQRAHKVAEAARVECLIATDKAYRAAEQDRKRAEVEVRAGLFVNLADTVIPPTPEWLAKGETRSFTPKQPDDTVRVIKTVRRVATPILVRMAYAGKLDQDQFTACRWYREVHEQAGISGRFKTSHLSLAGNVGGSGGTAQHPMAQHEREASARESYRRARQTINPRFLEVFEGVVIHDLSLRAASIRAKRDNARLLPRFTYSCNQLLNHLRALGMDFGSACDEGA